MRLAGRSCFLFICLLLIGLALRLAPPAAAQQQPGQEKRIALVIGNGAYAKGPLATTANDAGLIAQTLQAAGFDVIGARDLDGDSLRKSFRDFMQKAQSSDNNTVAMIYLAGYGVQMAGENYFIPVDSTINRDTDIPTEGLRIGDYLRQLAAIPLKASIVVLDAARQQPFVQGGQLAGGLALVEPDNNTLIAFNAAPGTVAPSESGTYGIYAQSLAEMIRTGGLSLPDVFDRVRLRVNEATKGAQVPWDAQKIQATFSFFDRAPDAPAAQAQPAQVVAMRERPLRELSVQEAYTAALERDSLQGYEEFLAAFPSDPLAKRVRALVAIRREAITWRRTYRADTPDAYWSYLRRYPHGPHAEDARRRLAILTAPLEPPPSFAMMDYDVPPPPPDEVIYVDRPVLMFSDPEFAFAPPPPPPLFVLPPPPPDFVVLSPPIEPVGLFVLPQPMFVPIPVYVRAPVYVAPPANNIIFNNIHNTNVINTVINQPPPPAPAPGAPVAAGPHPVPAAAPALPPAVAQRATLIQQGKAPVPPSAAISPIGRTPGTPQPAPANVTPSAAPSPPAAPAANLPHPNALPVPGSHGAPPAPAAVTTAPNPRTSSPLSRGQPPTPSNLQVNRTPPGATAAPSTKPPPSGAQPQTMPAAAPPARPEAHPRIERAAPPPAHPSPPAARLSAPPPAARPAPPPTVHAAPPPQAPRPPAAAMVRPSAPPPPRPAAPPPMARPAPPPPPPRPAAPPPQMARPAPPPPPMARPAPPPQQMARPAPPPQAARPGPPPQQKKCPPNVQHC
ncbi:caspase domain-containing protein [Bradyrhizobium sp. SZCCHNS3004]|uniref:caspase family protein n=1 Tax=Bradyrhizobium sp. SZCCHNS3004 TaxID=3057312 RepID=UPI00291649DE|nr:caspase family protein [Bradyrhizobium sp. SZCCHNS3004]